MLNNYIVYLLIFLLLLLLISRLLDISIFKMLYPIRSKMQAITTKLQEGMECSQGEKDELYKQKIKISNLKKENATIKNSISYFTHQFFNNFCYRRMYSQNNCRTRPCSRKKL